MVGVSMANHCDHAGVPVVTCQRYNLKIGPLQVETTLDLTSNASTCSSYIITYAVDTSTVNHPKLSVMGAAAH